MNDYVIMLQNKRSNQIPVCVELLLSSAQFSTVSIVPILHEYDLRLFRRLTAIYRDTNND